MNGLGSKAAERLSAYLDRAAARFVTLITEEQRQFGGKPQFREVTQVIPFGSIRQGRPNLSDDRLGGFAKGVGYQGWARSMYAQVWFDSRPERDVANIVDATSEVASWVRLHIGDLPILWSDAGNSYNPDLIVVENDGTHWVVEVKMDKEMQSADVQGKRQAAERWANYVSNDAAVNVRWRYLLVSETDVKDSKGSWDALKKIGGG
jgi:type III restriction enzyme